MKVLHTSKQSAISQKENKYWSSTPCKKGHVGLRYALKGNCVECARLTNIPATNRRFIESTKYLREIRETTPCADCKNHFAWFIMEFDHKSGKRTKKDKSPAWLSRYGIREVKSELAKCDIVCGNCHCLRTHSSRPCVQDPKGNRKLLRDIRANTSCHDCRLKFHWSVMEFDHVRGNKVYTIGKLSGKNCTNVIKAELEKCDLVCRNCHNIRTHKRRLENGTVKVF